jgi:polysaccharide deacetylase 2 family uncharacterized protein YibQ
MTKTPPKPHKSPPPKRINPLKPKRDFKAYIKFLLIAGLMVFVIDTYVWKDGRPYLEKVKQDYAAEQQALAERERLEAVAIKELLPPKIVFPDDGAKYFEAPPEMKQLVLPKEEELIKPIENENAVKGEVEPVVESKSKIASNAKPRIAIVIDDVGVNLKQSRVAMSLPKEVTLAFLPYAKNVRAMAAQAKAKGHEIIIHIPMEAMNSDVPLGGLALTSDMNAARFEHEFQKIAASFDGYSGVNNHMGSKLTQDENAMAALMVQLKLRGLYFMDSKTIHTSIAGQVAAQYDVPFIERDVFLDHEETMEYTRRALEKIEKIARANGSAIAIGHPKEITMMALQKWLPTLEGKGFELVPLGKLVE